MKYALIFFVCGGGYDVFHCEWSKPAIVFTSKDSCISAMYGNMNGYKVGQAFLLARCVEHK